MSEVDFHINQYHPTAMSKMMKGLCIKCYWILRDFDSAMWNSVDQQYTANFCS